MTALAGVVPFNIAGEKTTVEFLRFMPTVKPSHAEKLALEYEAHGHRVRVLDPISLLACKLHLALRVDQEGRRDLDHLSMLILCVRAFLRETLQGVESEMLPARGWLNAVERVLKLAESSAGAKAARKLGVDWTGTLPQSEISASKHPMVVQFREKRLPHWRAKLARRHSL